MSETKMEMTKIADGGLAFPAMDTTETGTYLREPGMSLRDYFAAKAMTGICARMPAEDFAQISDGTRGGRWEAEAAYTLADAMLKARSRKRN